MHWQHKTFFCTGVVVWRDVARRWIRSTRRLASTTTKRPTTSTFQTPSYTSQRAAAARSAARLLLSAPTTATSGREPEAETTRCGGGPTGRRRSTRQAPPPETPAPDKRRRRFRFWCIPPRLWRCRTSGRRRRRHRKWFDDPRRRLSGRPTTWTAQLRLIRLRVVVIIRPLHPGSLSPRTWWKRSDVSDRYGQLAGTTNGRRRRIYVRASNRRLHPKSTFPPAWCRDSNRPHLHQWCKQDHILKTKTKTKTKITRSRPTPPEVKKGTWWI